MSDPPKRPVRPESAPVGLVTAGHAVLFTDPDGERCDVCAAPVKKDDEDAGYDVRGRGLLVWARGDERRYQEPPLCAPCAAAVGVSALQRWEIEEEEG
ncbi:MAG: hypothetical protein JWP97_671 [Labilithrix sp.]|nr:hypothetical protein [Labilithrix sp.]